MYVHNCFYIYGKEDTAPRSEARPSVRTATLGERALAAAAAPVASAELLPGRPVFTMKHMLYCVFFIYHIIQNMVKKYVAAKPVARKSSTPYAPRLIKGLLGFQEMVFGVT